MSPPKRIHGNDSSNVQRALHQGNHTTSPTSIHIRSHDQSVKINKSTNGNENNVSRVHTESVSENGVRRSASTPSRRDKLQNNHASKYPQFTLKGDKKIISAANGMVNSRSPVEKDGVSTFVTARKGCKCQLLSF